MLKKDIILKNPLRELGNENQDPLLKEGEFGAVLAKAGLGKTALLVQIAFNTMLYGKNVLHISLIDPIKKVCLWYEDIFRNIVKAYEVEQTTQLWDAVLPHRFIMTFKSTDFSASILEERITELIEQDIFYPQLIMIDGFDFNKEQQTIRSLKSFAQTHKIPIWFSVKTNQNDHSNGLPTQVSSLSDAFEFILSLEPIDNKILIKAIKGKANCPPITLDPATMLIR